MEVMVLKVVAPVELTSFELLETRNDGITLQWVTESEINNLGFNLDRSYNK